MTKFETESVQGHSPVICEGQRTTNPMVSSVAWFWESSLPNQRFSFCSNVLKTYWHSSLGSLGKRRSSVFHFIEHEHNCSRSLPFSKTLNGSRIIRKISESIKGSLWSGCNVPFQASLPQSDIYIHLSLYTPSCLWWHQRHYWSTFSTFLHLSKSNLSKSKSVQQILVSKLSENI